jgi:ABC-type multidrug transport system ATPase subunit
MQPSTPSIQLESGFEIGYTDVLARFDRPVTLAGGTHFLLARNGRGKTTLLRTLARSLKPLAGDFCLNGFIQYLPENLKFDAELPVSMIFRTLLPKARFREALDLAGRIELDVKKTYGRLSTGNRRKTHLIVAEFSIRREAGNILLLDEPFSGLDAFARQAFEDIWHGSSANVLRLVSCHPDYDAMPLPSALMIEGKTAQHLNKDGQTWNDLKTLLN